MQITSNHEVFNCALAELRRDAETLCQLFFLFISKSKKQAQVYVNGDWKSITIQ